MGDGRWQSRLGVAVMAASGLLAGCTSRTLGGDEGDGANAASAGESGGHTDQAPGDAADNNEGGGDAPGNSDGPDEDDEAASGASQGFDEGGDEDCGGFLGCNYDLPDEILYCDFWAQDCDEGEKCIAAMTTGGGTWDAWVCVPAGPQPPGASCERSSVARHADTCDATSFCHVHDYGLGIGTCVEFCRGPPASPTCPQTSSTATCQRLYSGVLELCLPDCNPLLTGECPAGQICVANFRGQELGGFICFPPGVAVPGISGEPCACANCCASGHMCVAAEDYGPGCLFDICCTEYCDLDDGSFSCAGVAQSCVALFPPGTPVVGHIGRCQATP